MIYEKIKRLAAEEGISIASLEKKLSGMGLSANGTKHLRHLKIF